MRRLPLYIAVLAAVGAAGLSLPPAAHAQGTAAEILERARGQARDIEELRKVLNGPDQNMRLATFDAMVKSGDEALRLIAYETGLASADSVLRAMAFKALLLSQNNLHLTLTPDPSAPKPIQEASADYLVKNGSGLVVPIDGRNAEAGTFKGSNWQGQVSGTELVFSYGSRVNAQMSLQDDNAVAGVVRLDSGRTQFLAMGKLR
ncbi:MAG TPA: hypothetical protein PLF79_02940 [Thauera sp.]|uniref:hypothetical protein n=1 Tax=Thauera sp. TaxID=1905334 RepID=UPI002BE860CD|nr:hypothetical protein [Thauera sp.]HRP24335.1 hypothetical protein [Thauera sp.]HRP64996.1 hypothetical protein [Thauera sp.]